MRSAASTAVDQKYAVACRKRDEGDALFKRGDLIGADDAYGAAVQLVEGRPLRGQPRSQSGKPEEERLLATCLSNRAQCILDMAEGKGLLPDGTPFLSQFEAPEHFQYFRRQALKQAEECAEKACLVWADDKSLYRLGVARMLMAMSENPESWLRPDETIEQMKDAGRCLLKSIKANRTDSAERRLAEVKNWLAAKQVHTLYPEYV